MSKQSQTQTANIFPVMKYAHGAAAVEWLTKSFGFEPTLVYPGADGTIVHAELKLGSGSIMLGSIKPNPDPANPWDAAPFGMYVYVEDIQAHYDRAVAAGAEIVRPLAKSDYGSIEYSAKDCEGQFWSFGTYRPGDPIPTGTA